MAFMAATPTQSISWGPVFHSSAVPRTETPLTVRTAPGREAAAPSSLDGCATANTKNHHCFVSPTTSGPCTRSPPLPPRWTRSPRQLRRRDLLICYLTEETNKQPNKQTTKQLWGETISTPMDRPCAHFTFDADPSTPGPLGVPLAPQSPRNPRKTGEGTSEPFCCQLCKPSGMHTPLYSCLP